MKPLTALSYGGGAFSLFVGFSFSVHVSAFTTFRAVCLTAVIRAFEDETLLSFLGLKMVIRLVRQFSLQY